MMSLIRMFKLLATSLFGRSQQDRYAARFSFFSLLAMRMGFRLYNRNLDWLQDTETLKVWQGFNQQARHITDRKFILESMAQYTSHVPGDTAECGVFDGGSSYLMCRANINKQGVEHHVFDSFEGLSEPNPQLDTVQDSTAYVWQKHDLSIPLETVQKNLVEFDFVRYYKGWIPSRFNDVADKTFSFVHIDVDLYEPTWDSLVFFYDRLNAGGILLCDDYGSTICPGAKQAFDDFVKDKPEQSVIHLTTGQGFIVKQS